MQSMTDSQRALLRGNLLYAIATWGMLILGGIVSVITVILGAEAMTAYGAAYSITMIAIEFLALALPVLILLLMPSGHNVFRSLRLGFHPSALLAVPTGVAGYLFVLGFTAVWSSILTALGLGEVAGVATPSDGSQLGISLLIIAIWPALCEELLFRGVMLPSYERYFKNPLAAVCLTGMFFGLMHGQPSGAPGHIFLGIVMGALVVMTGSLWAGILYHFVNNATAVCLSFAISSLPEAAVPEASAQIAQMPGMTMLSGGVYFVVGGILFALCMGLVHLATKKRRKADPACHPLEEGRDALAMQEALYRRQQTKQQRFLPWLPLVIAAPVVLLNYGSMFLLMLISGIAAP